MCKVVNAFYEAAILGWGPSSFKIPWWNERDFQLGWLTPYKVNLSPIKGENMLDQNNGILMIYKNGGVHWKQYVVQGRTYF